MIPAGQRNAGAASNQYQILGHLATGGMAELYLARSVGLAGFERHVVLKRIMADYARNHRFVTMFLDEARLAAQLHHPNIAQVHDIGRVGDSYFFTMEYVHGENVRDVLQRVAALKRQIPFEVTLTIIAGAAAGLHYAHEKRGIDRAPLGIVHRDVSPSNLMVAYEGAIKLVDFGIAKASHRMTETRSGAVKGKVAYMSPEQCTGHPLDRRSDVFSLGIVLYELTTLTRLFKHATDFETMNHIVNHPVPPPSSRRADVPRELEQIILRALARRADDRFQTAGELLEAVEQFASRQHLALSQMGLSRYIRELFGERPEPWYELEAAGEQTGLVTVETAAIDAAALAAENSDPFAPNSTQRNWANANRVAGAWQPAEGNAAFGDGAALTAPTAPEDLVTMRAPLRATVDRLSAAIATVDEAGVRPAPSTPRKPSTNPAVAPPPPRVTGPHPLTAAGPTPRAPADAAPPGAGLPGLVEAAAQLAAAPVRATLAGHAPAPVGATGLSARLSAVELVPVSGAPLPDSATQIERPASAALVVQPPDVVRATPDRDPSWGVQHDPSWGGDAVHLGRPARRRWPVVLALGTALAAVAVIILTRGGDGSAASVGDRAAPAAAPTERGASRGAAGAPAAHPVDGDAPATPAAIEPAPAGAPAPIVPADVPAALADAPPATAPPATAPPATAPPATAPPATAKASTEPPATKPPATAKASTKPPATAPPATAKASTKPSTKPPTKRSTPRRPKPADAAPKATKKCGDAYGLYPPCE